MKKPKPPSSLKVAKETITNQSPSTQSSRSSQNPTKEDYPHIQLRQEENNHYKILIKLVILNYFLVRHKNMKNYKEKEAWR